MGGHDTPSNCKAHLCIPPCDIVASCLYDYTNLNILICYVVQMGHCLAPVFKNPSTGNYIKVGYGDGVLKIPCFVGLQAVIFKTICVNIKSHVGTC